MGYRVWAPQLPESDDPTLEQWLPFLLEKGRFDSETVVITHSSSGALMLAALEKLPVTIQKCVMVAGFAKPLPGGTSAILKTDYDWKRIRAHCREFVFINSDNDPWGCDDEQGAFLKDKLGGTLIVRHDGHFGSEKFNQSYVEFPLVLELVDG